MMYCAFINKKGVSMSDCKQAAGRFEPVIDRNRCEGKGPCVPVCPYSVLELAVVPTAMRAQLSVVGKLKGFVHGWRQAFVVQADACRACGLCVAACPEHAIKLVRRSPDEPV